MELNVQKDHVHLVLMIPPEGIDIGSYGEAQRAVLNEDIQSVS